MPSHAVIARVALDALAMDGNIERTPESASSLNYLIRGPITRCSCVAIGVLLLSAYHASTGQTGPPGNLIQQGFHSMYNLDFGHASQDFESWEKQHPDDPMGPVSQAAALLFSEFHRLGVLESKLFVDNQTYEDRKKPLADPNVKKQFEHQLALGDQLTDAALAKDPNDANALFAKVLSLGLRSDYAALIEKRNLAALSYTKQGRRYADQLLKEKPDEYDAYVALGVENYLTGIQPAPVRWFLRLGGMNTDKKQGIEELRQAADHGVLLAPFAKLLLAVAAFRAKDNAKGCVLLHQLASSYPQNLLYTKELWRCH